MAASDVYTFPRLPARGGTPLGAHEWAKSVQRLLADPLCALSPATHSYISVKAEAFLAGPSIALGSHDYSAIRHQDSALIFRPGEPECLRWLRIAYLHSLDPRSPLRKTQGHRSGVAHLAQLLTQIRPYQQSLLEVISELDQSLRRSPTEPIGALKSLNNERDLSAILKARNLIALHHKALPGPRRSAPAQQSSPIVASPPAAPADKQTRTPQIRKPRPPPSPPVRIARQAPIPGLGDDPDFGEEDLLVALHQEEPDDEPLVTEVAEAPEADRSKLIPSRETFLYERWLAEKCADIHLNGAMLPGTDRTFSDAESRELGAALLKMASPADALSTEATVAFVYILCTLTSRARQEILAALAHFVARRTDETLNAISIDGFNITVRDAAVRQHSRHLNISTCSPIT